MNNSYEVPHEMRDFAQRSVSQARKAFENFMGAMKQTTHTIDHTHLIQQGPVKDVSDKAVSFAQKNVTAAFDLAEKIVEARNFQDVVQLQSDYMRGQLELFQSQAKEMGDVWQRAFGFKSKE